MDDSPASKLPVELWIKIALTLRDGFPSITGPYSYPVNDIGAIRPLSESCRFLCVVVQPILYEHINVHATYKITHKIPSLAFTLSTRQDLQSSVRTLKLRDVQEEIQCNALLEVLPLLVEVRSLSIRSGVIEEAMIQLLRNALHLHTLHIWRAEWREDTPENWSEGGSFGGNLTELLVWEVYNDETYYLPRTSQLFVPTLTNLRINLRLLLKITESPAFPTFSPSLLQLYTLAHDSIFHLPLHQLLSRFPNLEDLDAEGFCLVSSVDEEFLPKLRSIHTDISLVTALLPGQSIRSITAEPNLELFAAPLPGLEELCLLDLEGQLEWPKIIDALLTACPGLVTLKLMPGGWKGPKTVYNQMANHLISGIAALPRLQILHVKYNRSDEFDLKPIHYPLSEKMQSERERIAQVKRQCCPDLSNVWLCSEQAWTYVQEDGAWTPQNGIVGLVGNIIV